jgi:type II secretory pathway pseudopilin PulG
MVFLPPVGTNTGNSTSGQNILGLDFGRPTGCGRVCVKGRLMKIGWQRLKRGRRPEQGMTLVEVLVAFVISGMAVGGIVSGYILANTSAERFGLSLAANAQASERMEQMRSAKWDTSSWPAIDELNITNFSNQVVKLESSWNGSNIIYATNFAQISTVSINPPLRRVRVDCVWNFRGTQVLTNTIETFRAPDQ